MTQLSILTMRWGHIASISDDTNTFSYDAYDANGNRLSQNINVNMLPLCLNTSVHGNPTTWGSGLWSVAGSGC